jgi:hypothetical protein
MVSDGNVKDATTLPQIGDQMRDRFEMKRCIFVENKGMVISKKRKERVEAGYGYTGNI